MVMITRNGVCAARSQAPFILEEFRSFKVNHGSGRAAEYPVI